MQWRMMEIQRRVNKTVDSGDQYSWVVMQLYPFYIPNMYVGGGGGSGTSAKLEDQERFSAHFFSCNALGLMLNFVKVGGAAAPSVLAVPRPLYICTRTGLSR